MFIQHHPTYTMGYPIYPHFAPLHIMYGMYAILPHIVGGRTKEGINPSKIVRSPLITEIYSHYLLARSGYVSKSEKNTCFLLGNLIFCGAFPVG